MKKMHVVTSLTILSTFIHLVISGNRLEPLYDWRNDYNRSVQEIVPWRNTLLQVTYEDALLIDTIDPNHNNPVNCTLEANFETGEKLNTYAVNDDKLLVNQYNALVIVNLPTCDAFYNMLRESCRQVLPSRGAFDCFYLKYNEYTGPADLGRFSLRDTELSDEFKVSLNTSPKHSNLIFVKSGTEDTRRAVYVLETLARQCENPREECNLSRLVVLDSNYRQVKEHFLKHSVTRFRSFGYDRFTFCNVELDLERRHPEGFHVNVLKCHLYDSEMRLEATASMDLAHYIDDWVKRAVAILNLPEGGAVILYHPHKSYRKILYRTIDANGRVSDKDEEFHEFTVDGYYYPGDIDLYFFEKDARERIYCAAMVKFGELAGKCVRIWIDLH